MSPNPVKPPTEKSSEPVLPDRPLHKLPPRAHSRRSPGTSGAENAAFPDQLFDQPTSVFVYGPSRPLVNLTLYALATATNPDFQWVEFGSLAERRMPCDPIRLGWIPPERLWVVDHPAHLRPGPVPSPSALFGMIRPDEAEDELTYLNQFLSLPENFQKILSGAPSDGRPGVVTVTNAERAEGRFSSDVVPAILEVHRRSGYSVIVGYDETARLGRDVFDFVFRLQGEDRFARDWRENELVCEKGVTSGPLRDRAAIRLEQIPLISEVLSRARPLS